MLLYRGGSCYSVATVFLSVSGSVAVASLWRCYVRLNRGGGWGGSSAAPWWVLGRLERGAIVLLQCCYSVAMVLLSHIALLSGRCELEELTVGIALLWCCYGVAMVLLWCCYSVAMVLLSHDGRRDLDYRWCYRVAIVLLQCCYRNVSPIGRICRRDLDYIIPARHGTPLVRLSQHTFSYM